jgi:protein-arginine deiminase
VPTVYTTGHIYAPGNGVLPSHNASAAHAASLYPAAINGVVFSEHKLYLAPRQWGPVIDGQDILQEVVDKVYEELGYRVIYVDNWQSHHQWGGEVHCGTNTVREASGPWWKY